MKKLKFTCFFYLILSFTLLCSDSQAEQTQQIPVSEGDIIEGQARNIKDIAHVNPIISVNFIEALTPYLPIQKVFMPQTFRIRVIFKKPPQGRTQPIFLSKVNRKTGEAKALFEVNLISEKVGPKVFVTNLIGIKDVNSNWSPAEPYAFPLVFASSKDVLQAAVGDQKTLVKTSDACNFLKMGISDIDETIGHPNQNYKPWIGKLVCAFITFDFKNQKNQTNFVKTVLNALSRNYHGEGWTLKPETDISNILILNSNKQKSNLKIKRAKAGTPEENNFNLLQSDPVVIGLESCLFDNSSKTINEKLVKAEKAILTIFGFKKASEMGMSLKKTKTQPENTKKTIIRNINAFRKEHLLKLSDNLILANGKHDDLLKWLSKFHITSPIKKTIESNANILPC